MTKARKRQPEYVDARSLRFFTWLMVLVAVTTLTAAGWALVSSLADPPTSLDVSVELTDGSTYEQAQAYVKRSNEIYSVPVSFRAGNDGYTLTVPDPTRLETLLRNGDTIVYGVTVAVCLMLLRRVFLSIVAGDPFGSRNAHRFSLVAWVSLVGALGSLVPQFGTFLVLDQYDRAEDPFSISFSFSLLPLVVMPITFLILAQAFRQGERLHRDVEGLV